MRMPQPVERLEPDEYDEQPQEKSVEESAQNFRAQIAVGLSARCGPRRNPQGQQSQAQGGDVREHVHGVGEQREAARPIAARQFADEVDRGDDKDDYEPTPVGLNRGISFDAWHISPCTRARVDGAAGCNRSARMLRSSAFEFAFFNHSE